MENTDKAKAKAKRAMRIALNRRKLIKELNKLKTQVPLEVEAEMDERIKVIDQVGYTLPDEEDYAEMAGRILKEAEKKVANRRKHAPYGNMEAEELETAWQSRPGLRIEFDNHFQCFVTCIQETFPGSPANRIENDLYLRGLSDEYHEKMIRDTKRASGEAGDKSEETWYWKLYEKTIKAAFSAILEFFQKF